jgi:colanic acid biosynthesis glycosyl transferase WcaI
MTDLAESLVERGVEVTVVAGRGRYNGGNPLSKREIYRGVIIERAWSTSYGKSSIIGRVLDYLSFYIGSTWKLLWLSNHDIILALTTPPLIGLVALLLSWLRRMRLVTLVQDIYPDVAVALGTLNHNSLSTQIFDWLNCLILKGSAHIIVLGECMRERVISKIGNNASSRVDIIHNWADGKQIIPIEEDKNLFTIENSISGKFVVLFSGNLGLVNDFHAILRAALSLKNNEDILFLFIGDGAKAEEIRVYSNKYSLNNIRLLSYQPRNSLSQSLASGHVLLVTLSEKLTGLSVPSKTYGIMAAARPILFIGNSKSTTARLIDQYKCGFVISPNNSEKLTELIKSLASNRAITKAIGLEARKVFDQFFDRPHAVNAYMQVFTKCLNTSSKQEQPNSLKVASS